jgi:Protein of unknown function (DUF4085)
MIFFTRELYLGYQPGSGWERRAEREWDRRRKLYERYADAVEPMLPTGVRRLCREGLHDGIVLGATRERDRVVLIVDATNALSRFARRIVRLTFHGVRGRPALARLADAWWLYEEAHLSPRARFSLQVLFHQFEWEIEADGLTIEVLPRGRVLTLERVPNGHRK